MMKSVGTISTSHLLLIGQDQKTGFLSRTIISASGALSRRYLAAVRPPHPPPAMTIRGLLPRWRNTVLAVIADGAASAGMVPAAADAAIKSRRFITVLPPMV